MIKIKTKTDYRLSMIKWRIQGFKHTEEEFKEIFKKVIISTHCEVCKKEFTENSFRCCDHHHPSGSFRYICCSSCNAKMAKIDRNKDKVLLELHKYFINNNILF